MTETHGALCNALLPLAHSGAFFERGAFLQQEIPTTVRVSGPHARTGKGKVDFLEKKTKNIFIHLSHLA